MVALLLLAGLLQQRPAPAPQHDATPAFDSTTQVVRGVAFSVADVKGSLELYRRAVFNWPDTLVLSSAAALQRSCQSLDRTALAAVRKVCRHCGSPDLQRALEGYRGVLPSVARMGAGCARRLRGLLRSGPPEAAARRLRGDVGAISNAIYTTLVSYEGRVADLRRAVAEDRPSGAAPPPAR